MELLPPQCNVHVTVLLELRRYYIGRNGVTSGTVRSGNTCHVNDVQILPKGYKVYNSPLTFTKFEHDVCTRLRNYTLRDNY